MTEFKVEFRILGQVTPVLVSILAENIADAATRLTVGGQVVLRVKDPGGTWVRVVVNRDGQCQFPIL